jgi:hypothetical protein
MISVRNLARYALVIVATSTAHAVNVRTEGLASRIENIGRSSAPTDWRDAMRYEARTAVNVFREWRAGFLTAGELNAGYEHVPKFSNVNAFTGGLSTTIRQKFGFGAFAPSVSLDLGLRGRDARVNGDDGWTTTAGLRVNKRISEAWRLGAVADWQQHYSDSQVFATRHHRVLGTVAWDINDRLQLSTGNGRLWGDFTANASPTVWSQALSGALGDNIAQYYNTVSRSVTHAYGPGWFTYRVTGRVSFWWLELSPALGRNTSLPLRYESLFSVNKAGVKYRQDIWTLQVLHRF